MMLSSTYVKVAVLTENNSIREKLQKLLQQTAVLEEGKTSAYSMQTLLETLQTLRRACIVRQFEMHFLPEVERSLSEQADVLDQRGDIQESCKAMHEATCAEIETALAEDLPFSAELAERVRQYAFNMTALLDEEEKNVMKLAQDKVSNERWFSLAKRFMSQVYAEPERRILLEMDESLKKNSCLDATITGQKDSYMVEYPNESHSCSPSQEFKHNETDEEACSFAHLMGFPDDPMAQAGHT